MILMPPPVPPSPPPSMMGVGKGMESACEAVRIAGVISQLVTIAVLVGGMVWYCIQDRKDRKNGIQD